MPTDVGGGGGTVRVEADDTIYVATIIEITTSVRYHYITTEVKNGEGL